MGSAKDIRQHGFSVVPFRSLKVRRLPIHIFPPSFEVLVSCSRLKTGLTRDINVLQCTDVAH